MYFLCYPIGVYCVYITQEVRMIPIVIISGFLASGKKTFLQHIFIDNRLVLVEELQKILQKQGLPFVKLHLAVFAVAYKETSNKHSLIFFKIMM